FRLVAAERRPLIARGERAQRSVTPGRLATEHQAPGGGDRCFGNRICRPLRGLWVSPHRRSQGFAWPLACASPWATSGRRSAATDTGHRNTTSQTTHTLKLLLRSRLVNTPRELEVRSSCPAGQAVTSVRN